MVKGKINILNSLKINSHKEYWNFCFIESKSVIPEPYPDFIFDDEIEKQLKAENRRILQLKRITLELHEMSDLSKVCLMTNGCTALMRGQCDHTVGISICFKDNI